MNDLVSIITPCYNGEKYIARFLDSVLVQTYNNIEMILINDGSTDNTDDIVKKYKPIFFEKGIKFIYITQDNMGQSEAINKGLKIFSGDFFIWPDSDDVLDKDNIKLKVECLNENPTLGLVICKTKVVNSLDINKTIKIEGRKKPKIKVDNLFKDIIMGDNIHYAPGAYMIRSSMFFKVNNNRQIIAPKGMGQNYQLLLPISYHYGCGYINQALYTYIIRSDSHSNSKLSFEEMVLRFEIAKKALITIIKAMNITDEKYYVDQVLYKRYHMWLIKAGLIYNNKSLVEKNLEKLNGKKMLSIKDKFYYFYKKKIILFKSHSFLEK